MKALLVQTVAVGFALAVGGPFAAPVAVPIAWAKAPPASAANERSRTFLRKAIRADETAIRLGQLAEQKGATPPVRSFGAMLAIDHAAALRRVEALAEQRHYGIKDPGVASVNETNGMYKSLSPLTGLAFDREFAIALAKDHEKDIRLFSREAGAKDDPQVAQLARDALPKLKKHLRIAKALAESESVQENWAAQ